MITEATWFFELGKDRFKKVLLTHSEEITIISVVIYDDLGIEVSQRDDRIQLKPPFVCTTSTTEVSFKTDSHIYRF